MEEAPKARLLTIALAIFVRFLLVLHNILAAWRLTIEWNSSLFWLMSLGASLVVAEGYVTIRFNKGIEWSRFCPCFAVYLVITLPAIWLLEISQMNKYIESQAGTAITANVTLTSTTVQTVTSDVTRTLTTALTSDVTSTLTSVTMATTTSNLSDIVNASIAPSNTSDMFTNNATHFPTIPFTNTTAEEIITNIEILLDSFSSDTWVVMVEEALVYLIVIGRWLLPRGKVNREELSDLLIDYLGMASDIMELFALFDEDSIRGNPKITYAILAIWSISFIQFIPVVMNSRAANSLTKRTQKEKDKTQEEKDKTQEEKDNSDSCVCAGCGDSFPDIFSTLTGLFLQDVPFLALRLFVIFYLQLITYSLVFFVLKNIIVVLLLTYRLGILCFNLPCWSRGDATKECTEGVELDDPIDFGSREDILKKNELNKCDDGIINIDFQDDKSVSGDHDHNKTKNGQQQNGHSHIEKIEENPGNPVNGLSVFSV